VHRQQARGALRTHQKPWRSSLSAGLSARPSWNARACGACHSARRAPGHTQAASAAATGGASRPQQRATAATH
jgi:hypothetical protein